MLDFNFSVVMAVYNVEKFLGEAIDSLINQTIGFEDNIQLILIDDGSLDNSREIALSYQKKFPNNIILISKENGGVASARNLGLKNATGKYINFMDSDDKFSLNAFEKVYKFFKKHNNEDFDVATVPIMFFESKTGDHPLNFKFEKEQVIDLSENPEYIQVVTNASFIKKEAIKDLEFDPKPMKMEDALFINKIILSKNKYGLVKGTHYSYRKRFDGTSITTGDGKYRKEFYTGQLKYFYKELINFSINKLGYLPDFIKNLFVYDLRWIVEVPLENIRNVFDSDEELNEFWDYLDDVLSYIDIDIIENHVVIPHYVKKFLIYLKNEKDFYASVEDEVVRLMSKEYVLNNLNIHNIWTDIIQLKNGFLYISGSYSSICSNDHISIEAVKNVGGKDETYETKFYYYKNTTRETVKYLSIPWKYTYSFDVKIPISDNDITKISFNVIYDENGLRQSFQPKIKFRNFANLSKESHYFIKDSKIVIYKPNNFYVEPYNFKNHLKYELRSALKVIEVRPHKMFLAIYMKILYFILFPFLSKRNIWIFMDRRNAAGDNGEHFFDYVYNQKNKDIEIYFTIEKDSADFKRLKELYGDKVIPFDSLKHRILYLFADKVISSHPDDSILNPFYGKSMRLYSGLRTSQIYFLQHGVGKYDMSRWLRKYAKNVSLLLTVSDLDYKSFIENYNYGEEVVQTLGFPRFDNLNNENLKKQIVIILSWRNFIKNEDMLLDSEYYERINSLINNESLINHCKEKGYDIVLKLHPLMTEYIDCFDKNEYIKFDDFTSFHELICDSALMVTDYSSVAFDFAYLKKPILYYQYGDDYHFDVESSYFDDEKDGFGRLIRDEDELVDEIIKYVDNDCEMEEFYKERVDKFFKYTDKNNSKRVYKWILDH